MPLNRALKDGEDDKVYVMRMPPLFFLSFFFFFFNEEG